MDGCTSKSPPSKPMDDLYANYSLNLTYHHSYSYNMFDGSSGPNISWF